MLWRKPLFFVAVVIVALGLYLIVRNQKGKTAIKVANLGELSTNSLGLVTLVIGAGLAYFCTRDDQVREAAIQTRRTQERQTASRAASPGPSVSVSQSSTGDGSPNIGVVNGGSVTIQVEKPRTRQ
jgi:hypothetical protein